MPKREYWFFVSLALVINLLIYFVNLAIGSRETYLLECIGRINCEYSIFHSFNVRDIAFLTLFFTPLVSVAVSFRSTVLQLVLIAIFLLVLLYNLAHMASIWNKSFDIHGDEVGLFNLIASIAIGALGVAVSVITTATSYAFSFFRRG